MRTLTILWCWWNGQYPLMNMGSGRAICFRVDDVLWDISSRVVCKKTWNYNLDRLERLALIIHSVVIKGHMGLTQRDRTAILICRYNNFIWSIIHTSVVISTFARKGIFVVIKWTNEDQGQLMEERGIINMPFARRLPFALIIMYVNQVKHAKIHI